MTNFNFTARRGALQRSEICKNLNFPANNVLNMFLDA